MKRKIVGYVFAFMAMLLWMSLSDRVVFCGRGSKKGRQQRRRLKLKLRPLRLLHRRRAAPAPKLPPYFTATSPDPKNAAHLGRIRRALPPVCGQLQPVTAKAIFLISYRCKTSMIGWRTTYIRSITFGRWSPVFWSCSCRLASCSLRPGFAARRMRRTPRP